MELIILAVFAGIVTALIQVAFSVGRHKTIRTAPQEKIVYQQKCGYCGFDIVGTQELDLINHSHCISRTPEELAELRAQIKKSLPKPSSRWLINVDDVWTTSPGAEARFWNLDSRSGLWYRYKWEIYQV